MSSSSSRPPTEAGRDRKVIETVKEPTERTAEDGAQTSTADLQPDKAAVHVRAPILRVVMGSCNMLRLPGHVQEAIIYYESPDS